MRAPPWQGHSVLANVSLDECGFTTDNTDYRRSAEIRVHLRHPWPAFDRELNGSAAVAISFSHRGRPLPLDSHQP
jgi:hypothetical protein